ncbi:hypothetical protein [Cellulophaga baltica]|uniref:hypothetical protein n=1 Tax=Cellulophaga baltica TaxID=76594 RepID=UPI002494F681|nr:hypothetical protein [Cellulophaga baltica]
MAEFWVTAFNDKQEMWGMNPAQSAELTKHLFIENKLKNYQFQELDMDEMRKRFSKVQYM